MKRTKAMRLLEKPSAELKSVAKEMAKKPELIKGTIQRARSRADQRYENRKMGRGLDPNHTGGRTTSGLNPRSENFETRLYLNNKEKQGTVRRVLTRMPRNTRPC
jgi:hypothetical protein